MAIRLLTQMTMMMMMTMTTTTTTTTTTGWRVCAAWSRPLRLPLVRRRHSTGSGCDWSTTYTQTSNGPTTTARTDPAAAAAAATAAATTPLQLAQRAITVLSRRTKSWQRLRPVIDLALGCCGGAHVRGVTDVGTDHGLLALGLAASGQWDRVVGIDVSETALQQGALRLWQQYVELCVRRPQPNDTADSSSDTTPTATTAATPATPTTTQAAAVPLLSSSLPVVEFRLGHGLTVARRGEADVVCMAGMGVSTMMTILQATTRKTDDDASSNQQHSLLDDVLQCQHLVLQPTNARPRHLIRLYEQLYHHGGWIAQHERIACLPSSSSSSSRLWYITTRFDKQQHATTTATTTTTNRRFCHWPGELLADDDDVFRAYVRHHWVWMQQDRQHRADIRDTTNPLVRGVLLQEDRWMQCFQDRHSLGLSII
jgi:hypothetical protein